MRLALKFTLVLYVVMCVAFAVNACLRVNREVDFLRGDMKHDQRLAGRAILRAFKGIWEARGEAKALEFIDAVKADGAGADGRVDINWVWRGASGGDPRAPLVPPEELPESWDGTPFERDGSTASGAACIVVYCPSSTADGRQGAIEVAESVGEIDRFVNATILRTIYSTVLIALACGAVAVAMGYSWVGLPIQRLIRKARRVSVGDLAGPLDLRPRNEIALLAGEFNAMCDRLLETQQKLLAETSARMAVMDELRAAERLRTAGTLASGLAHELGTPLNVVQARAKMIASGEVAGEDVASNACIIAEQSARMTAILRRFLDFAKPRGPKKARVDVVQLARDTIALFAPIAKKRRTELVLIDDGRPLASNADQDQLQQALANLIDNGMQAMPEGGKVTVECSRADRRGPAEQGEREGAYACIAVSDAGLGIAEEQKAHIFEPFFSTRPRGEGTGLGLTIARSIAREHGGWMEFESAVGKGSCFRLYIPRESE